MENNLKLMSVEELAEVNGGGIDVDVNELVRQLNPMQWAYDFGHDVIYPFLWKPLKGLFS